MLEPHNIERLYPLEWATQAVDEKNWSKVNGIAKKIFAAFPQVHTSSEKQAEKWRYSEMVRV